MDSNFIIQQMKQHNINQAFGQNFVMEMKALKVRKVVVVYRPLIMTNWEEEKQIHVQKLENLLMSYFRSSKALGETVTEGKYC